ncbi:(Fe-S)-binding protein [Candidatus Entotheonella palauensis]|uniref:(Fe-S)-binding protein n=1 Tax=Candidatus Entotheonella palauensis TaxID=93172 RepID=UPI000B7D9379|nr:heterodisulfide reductase-related iron-sulfur binding cluster [Candidatus Entotheonella palauensis]
MSEVMTVAPSSLLHELQQAETSCIKCGFCLPTCPTYRLTGSEAASPRGRIDLMQAVAYGELEAEEIYDQLDLCLGCRACETACPAGVEFGKLLETGRAVARVGAKPSRLEAWLRYVGLHVLLTSPGGLWVVAGLLRFYQVSGLQTLLRNRGWLERLSPAMAAAEATMPVIPATMVRQRVPSETAPEGEVRDTVAMLTGCVMPELLPQVNHATVHVLAANGYGVMAPPAQRCCGALQAHAGELEKARQLAKHNIEVFESTGASRVVVNSAGCGAMTKDYGHLLSGDAEFANRAQAFSQRVCDISELLAAAPLRGKLRPLPMRVAYDDPCHLLHGQRVHEQPRTLLRQVPELELLEVPEGDWCCGSAGIYNLVHAEMAQALLDRKMEHMASIQPQLIVTGNPGCLLQLRQGVKRHQLDVEVMHPIEVLAQAYTPATPASSA